MDVVNGEMERWGDGEMGRWRDGVIEVIIGIYYITGLYTKFTQKESKNQGKLFFGVTNNEY